jgi:Cu/Ag efflux protein CusF
MNMIKRLLAFSLILLTASLGASLGLAAVAAHQMTLPSLMADSSPPKTFSGEIVAADSSKNEVVVKDSAGSEVHIAVNESTKLIKGGKAVSLADLKPGDKVTIDADEAEGKLVAKTIAVATE